LTSPREVVIRPRRAEEPGSVFIKEKLNTNSSDVRGQKTEYRLSSVI
jgi:hypothetical protein